jgi:predicted RNA-binding protein YlxR (DUF448 family)
VARAGLKGRPGLDGARDAQSRLCALSRTEQPIERLIRFVADPAGSIVPDVARKLPGRGVWISATRASVADAVRKGVFARSLKRSVTADAGLPDLVDRLLQRRLEEAFSLANKSGLVVCGTAKVETAIERGEAIALVHAADAGRDGVEKLDRRFAARAGNSAFPGPDAGPLGRLLTASELSLAIGRPNVVHAALTEGGASRRLLDEAVRLDRYRSGTDVTAAIGPSEGSNTEKA